MTGAPGVAIVVTVDALALSCHVVEKERVVRGECGEWSGEL